MIDYFFNVKNENGRTVHDRLYVNPKHSVGEMCWMFCFEWSDGRLSCPVEYASIVQRSPINGKFIWYNEYLNEIAERGEHAHAEKLIFTELMEAYDQMQHAGFADDCNYYCLLTEIVHAYNDAYHRENEGVRIPRAHYKFFVKAVIELLRVGKNRLSTSFKVELYREIGMFSKCFNYGSDPHYSRDENEIIDEVLFRAAQGDTSLFIIENLKIYEGKTRRQKRIFCHRHNC